MNLCVLGIVIFNHWCPQSNQWFNGSASPWNPLKSATKQTDWPFHFVLSVSPISKPTLDRIQWTFRYWLLFLGTILSGKINKNKSKENESRNAVPKVSVGGHIKATKQIALFFRDCRFVWKRLFSVGYAFQRFDSVWRKQWLIGIARTCGLQHVLRFRKNEWWVETPFEFPFKNQHIFCWKTWINCCIAGVALVCHTSDPIGLMPVLSCTANLLTLIQKRSWFDRLPATKKTMN